MLPPPVRFMMSEARAYADALIALLPRIPPPLPESAASEAVQSPEELVTSRTRLIDRIRALDALSARGPVADVTAPRLIDRIRSSAAAAPAPSAPVPVDASAVPPPLPMDTALDGAYAIQTVILSPDRVSDVRALIGRRDRTVLGAQLESLIAGVEREQDHLWEAMEAHKAIGDTVTAERISNALSEYTGALSGLWLAEYSLAELSETWSPLERMRMWREFDASLRSAADGLATARDVLGGARPTPTASGFSSPGRLGGGSGAGSGSDDGGSRIERMKRGGIIGALLAALYASYVTMNPWDAPPVEPTDADKKEDPAARHRPVKTIPIKTQNPAPKDEPREEEPVPTENEIIDDLERARDGKPLPPGWKRDGDEIVAPNGERFAVPPREDAPIDRLAPERLRAMTPEELKDLRQRKLDELAGMPEDGSGRRKPIIDDVNAIDAELKRRESDAPRTAERPTDTKEAPDTKAAPDTKTGPRDTTMPGTGTRDPGATRETSGPDAGMPGSTKSGTGAGGLGSFGNVFGLLSQLMKLAGLTLPASTQPQAAQPVNSWVTLTPEKLIAQKGERVKLEWRGTGVQECTVYSKNGPLATGGSQGIVSTPALEQTSIFRLVCTKPGGGVVEVFTSIRIPGTPEPSQSDITSQGFQGVPNATAVRLPPVNNTCNPQDPRMNLRTYLACIGYPYDPRWEPR